MEKKIAKAHSRRRRALITGALAAFCSAAVSAQQPAQQPGQAATQPVQPPPKPQTPPPLPTGPMLTLEQAEAMAVQNHPQIAEARNQVAYSNQLIVENKAANFPTVNGDLTGSGANDNARIGAGFITDSRLFDRFGTGLQFTQLITDFGRTHDLIASSRLDAQASAQNALATRYDVLLAVNRAYFDVLHSKALIRTAQETINARQTVVDQVSQLARNQLRSDLDVELAQTDLSEAKLLLIQAQNTLDNSYAELARALGATSVVTYDVQEMALPAKPADSPDDLIAQAIANRPEFASLRLSRDAAYKFADAERDLKRPTVNAFGYAGYIPYIQQLGSTPIPADYYAGALNISVPIFNGHLFTARHEAALQKAMESDQRLRDEQLRLSRDVRQAWANAATAYQRIPVTEQMMQEANLAVKLAQGRYNLGLASIVELSRSLLNQTEAEIENLNARYDYESLYQALQYTIGQLR